MAITFQVGFQVVGAPLGEQLKPSLETLQKEIDKAFSTDSSRGLSAGLADAVKQAQTLEAILTKATTEKGLSFYSMQSALREAGTSAEHMVATLGGAGQAFSGSFNLALKSLNQANRSVISISSQIKEMQRVMSQSVKFTAAQGIQRAFMSAVSSAISWVKELNTEIAQIGTVTGKVGTELDKVYTTIINGSRELRVAASDYAEAALIFYQQGLSDKEVERRTEITIKAARAAGASVSEMSSQLTAIFNSYNMIGDEQARAASIGAKLAASTAVDFSDIAEAMQTSAAAAQQMGVSYESLAAIISTVGDATQQSASVIGNAYKTIFSRFQQLTTEGTDGEITLNAVSSKLKSLGVDVVDASGRLRDLDEVILETGQSWENWSNEQQLAIAQLVGGTRQYGQFLALMQNFDKYLSLKNIAENEDGSELERQFLSAQDTIEVAAENAREAWSEAFSDIFKADGMADFYKMIEKVGNEVGGVIDAMGGLPGIIGQIALLMANNILPKIENIGYSIKDMWNNLTPARQMQQITDTYNKIRQGMSMSYQGQRDAIQASDINEGAKKRALNKLDYDEDSSNIVLRNSEKVAAAEQQIIKLKNEGNSLTRIQAEGLERQIENQKEIIQQSSSRLTAIREEIELENIRAETALKNAEAEAQAIRDKYLMPHSEGDISDKEAVIEKQKEEAAELDEQIATLNKKLEEEKAIWEQLEEIAKKAMNNKTNNGQSAKEETAEYNATKQAKREELDAIEAEITARQNRLTVVQQGISQNEKELTSMKKVAEGDEVVEKGAAEVKVAYAQLRVELGKVIQEYTKAAAAGKKVDFSSMTGSLKNAFSKVGLELGEDFWAQFSKGMNISDATSLLTQLQEKMQAATADDNIPFAMPTSNLEDAINIVDSLAAAEARLAGAVGATSTQFSLATMDSVQYFNSLVTLGTAALSVGNSLTSLVSSISSGNLGGAISGITMLLMGIKRLGPEVTKLTQNYNNYKNAKQLMNIVQQTENGQIEASVLAKTLDIEVTDNMTMKELQAEAAKRGVTFATNAEAGALVKDSAVKKVNTVETLKNIAAQAAMHPVITSIVAVITALVAILTIANKIHEERRELLQKNMEESREAAQTQQELTDNINTSAEALADYNEQLSESNYYSEEYAEAGKGMVDAARELSKQLEDTNLQLEESIKKKLDDSIAAVDNAKSQEELALAYKKVAEAAKEAQIAQLNAQIDASNNAKGNAESKFISDMREDTGHLVGSEGYSAEFSGGMDWSDEKATKGKYQGQYLGDVIKDQNYSYIKRTGNGSFNIEASNSEEWVEAYREAQDLLTVLNNSLDGTSKTTSEVYKDLVDWLEKSADSFAALDEATQQVNESLKMLLTLDPKSAIKKWQELNPDVELTDKEETAVKKIDLESVDSLSSFEEQEAYLNRIRKLMGLTKDDMNEILLSMSNTAPFVAASDKIDEYLRKLRDLEAQRDNFNDQPLMFGDQASEIDQILANSLSKDDLVSYYDSLSDFDKTLFLKLDFDTALTEESLEKQMDLLRKRTATERIKIGLQVVQDSDGTFSENDLTELKDILSAEEFAAFSKNLSLMSDGTYLFRGSLEDLTASLLSARDASLVARFNLDGMTEQLRSDIEVALNSAQSINELRNTISALQSVGAESSTMEFSNALLILGEKSDNAKEEVLNLKAAIASGNDEAIIAAQNNLELAISAGELAEAYGLPVNQVESLAKSIYEANKENGMSAEIAADASARYIRLNNSVQDLNDNYDDWTQMMSDASVAAKKDTASKLKEIRASEELSGVFDTLKESVAGLLGTSQDMFNDEFVLDNMDLIKQAADGDIAAIQQLQMEFANYLNTLYDVGIGQEEMNAAMEALNNISPGGAITSANEELWSFIDAMFQAMAAAGMSASEIEAAFAGMNIDVDVEPLNESLEEAMANTETAADAIISAGSIDAETNTQEVTNSTTTETPVPYEATVDTTWETVTAQVPSMSGDQIDATPVTFSVPQFTQKVSTEAPITEETESTQVATALKLSNAHRSAGGELSHHNTSVKNGGANAGGGSNGGKRTGKSGGGGSSKNPDYKKQKRNDSKEKNYTERYTNIDSVINQVTQSLEKLNDAEEDAWGAQKVRNLRAINTQLAVQNRNYQERLRQARQWLKYDQEQLLDASKNTGAAALGLSSSDLQSMFIFNENGSIGNRENIIKSLYTTYVAPYEAEANALIDAYNAAGVGNDEATEAISAANDKLEEMQGYVDKIVELMDQVDESSQEVYDTWQNIINGMRDQVSNLVSQIQTKYEFRIAVDQRDLDTLSRLIDRLGDAGVDLGETFDRIWKKADAAAVKMNDTGRTFNEAYNLMEEFRNANAGDQKMYDQVKSFFFGKSLTDEQSAQYDELFTKYLEGNGGLPEELLTAMQGYRDDMVDAAEELIDIAVEGFEALETQVNNWFDKTFGDADHIIELSEAQLDLADRLLEFKGTSGLTSAGQQANRDIMGARMNVAQTKLDRNIAEKTAYEDAAKAYGEQREYWQNELNGLEEETEAYNYAAAMRDKAYNAEKEALQAAQDAEVGIVEATTEILEVAAENIEKEKEIAKANIATAINGLFSDIADMTNMYSLLQDEKTMKLDDYDKNYELNRLQNKYNDEIENIDPSQMSKLVEWQEKLNKYKEEGREMTQSEVDLLEKALEVEIARANFEDARNAKNTMRLQRDASGNYSYVYSNDAVDSSQEQQLAQLEYEYKKLLENTEDAFNESVINTAAKLQEEIENIDFQLYYSSELYRRSVDTKISSLLNQMEISGAAATQVLDIMGDGIINWSYDFSQSTAGILTDTKEMDEMLNKFKVALVGENGYVPGSSDTSTYYGAIMEAQRYWAEEANTTLEESTGKNFGLIDEHIKGTVERIAGTSGYYNTLILEQQRVGQVVNGVLIGDSDSVTNSWNEAEKNIHDKIGDENSKDVGTVNGNLNILKEKMTEIKNHQNTELNSMLDNLSTFTEKWETYYKRQIQAIDELIQKMKELEDAQKAELDNAPDVTTADQGGNSDTFNPPTVPTSDIPVTTPTTPSTPTTTGNGTPYDDATLAKGIAASIWIDPNSDWKKGGSWKPNVRAALGDSFVSLVESALLKDAYTGNIYREYYNGPGNSLSAYTDNGASSFRRSALGLYTGGLVSANGVYELAEEGPELVLNAEDTKNILAAVSMMRQTVAAQLGSINTQIASSTASMAGGVPFIPTNSQSVAQDVHIEASFPGVSVASEIEDALNSLITQAAQYNFKK